MTIPFEILGGYTSWNKPSGIAWIWNAKQVTKYEKK